MGKRWVMGPDAGMDDPATINLDLGFVGGPGTITRYDDGGNPSSNPFDTVSIIGHTYIADSVFNQTNLVGVDGNDELVGTNGDDLIVWEQRLTGIGTSKYLLPVGGAAAIDNFTLGAGNDILNLTYIDDHNTGTPDIAYTSNANINGGTGDDIIWSGQGNDVIIGGGGGTEILYGGGGNDQIVGSTFAFNNISGDSGNDELFGGSSGDGIVGGTEDDSIFGNSGVDFVDGEAGNDTVFGGAGDDNAFGGAGNDTVSGDGEADDIDGGTGFLDTLYGGSGDDFISDPDGAKYAFGNSENDIIQIGYDPGWNQGVASLYGGSGTDTISATGALNSTINVLIRADDVSGVGDGNDFVSMRGSYAASTAFLGGGTDSFSYLAFVSSNGARVDTVFGGAGTDTISTGVGADQLFGDAGDDTLEGGADGDTMYGGSEIDAISYASSTSAVTMGLTGVMGVGGDASGDVAWTDVENLTGSEQSDSLYGNNSVNTILGLGGNDTIEGLAGGDSLDGGTGANWLSYANSDQGVTINFLTGTGTGGHANGDIVANFQNLIGSSHDDVLTGSAATNVIIGGAGIDTIEGGGSADTLYGGGNGDFLSYAGSTAVSASLLAGSGTGGDAAGDVFSGFQHLIGSAQGDTLTGDAQNNCIVGGGGVDTVQGGVGGDALFGGGNGDWLSYAGSAGGVTINLATGTASGGDAAGDSFSGFQHLIGSGQADVLTGSAAANTIDAGGGNDVVQGGGGSDSLIGGSGIDELSYAAAPVDGDSRLGGVTVALSSGTGIGSDALGDTNSGFENLTGTEFFDSLTGDAVSNVIRGLGGFDDIRAGNGNDTMYGGLGNDILGGEGGLDSLFGDDGADMLQLNSDSTVGVGGIVVAGWDGETASGPINVAVAAGTALYGDVAFGGLGDDTLDLSGVSNAGPRTAYFSANANVAQLLAGVELILAGSAADVINLTFNNGSTRAAYTENVTIFAGTNADVVFSGSGNDLVVGGRAAGVGGGESGDTLYGGGGNDYVVGDDLDGSVFGAADFLYGGQGDDTVSGGVGGDSLYGGAGIDSLDGGDGNDTIFDSDGASFVSGGMGSDAISIFFNNPAIIGGGGGDGDGDGGRLPIVIYGGNNSTAEGVDGDDRVFVAGTYDEINAGLGAGNDLYISARVGTGTLRDLVDGGGGTDVISTWGGDDIIDGGAGGDALWGGAGVDTIIGGPDTDILYGGAGDGDLLIGGDGSDYYYWARTDGVDRIEDRDTVGGGQADNFILVQPDFDPVTGQMVAGNGVFETDHDLYDNAGGDDMVQLVDLDGAGAGTMYRLTILQGAGAGSSIEFDQTEISVIGLWNNDAMGATPVITAYVWDPIDQRYEYQA